MLCNRRDWLFAGAAGIAAARLPSALSAESSPLGESALTITRLNVTPIALADPPLLAASGCHGPYFLRNIVELKTDAGVVASG